MPVYNGGKFLRLSIASILNQSFHDFEFIIVDDGSTDCTSEVLSEFIDSRLVIISRENRGISASLNEAISRSKARYIARMDADDIATPRRLELQFSHMEGHPEVGILGGQALIIDENEEVVGEAKKPVGFSKVKKYMEYACPVMHPTYFVKKSVFTLTKGYRLLPVEDYDFLLRALELGVVIDNLPDVLVRYRMNSLGVTLADPQRTIRLTKMIKSMHKKRSAGDFDGERHLLNSVLDYSSRPGWWFEKVYAICYFFMGCLIKFKRKNNKIGVVFSALAITFFSILHRDIFLSSFSAYKASKLV